jgi:hypothetical protein
MKKRGISIGLGTGAGIVILAVLVRILWMDGAKEPISERTLLDNRKQFEKNLIENIILETVKEHPDTHNYEAWESACWAMGLIGYRDETTEKAVKNALGYYDSMDTSLLRALLEISYGLYPAEFIPEIRKIMHYTNDPKLFSMAGLYLNRAEFTLETAVEIRDRLNEKFYHMPDNPILEMFRAELHFRPDRPPLDLILSEDFLPESPVFFTFFRQNRDYPGITILRKSSGQFLTDKKTGKLWNVTHLGRSKSNLPGYITNGNTPEGLFSVQGISVSENVFIGPTPLIVLSMPGEVLPVDFFHGAIDDSAWSRQLYMSVLPRYWFQYLPAYTTYYAGMAGRREIVAHGTTIDPNFSAEKPWFPLTPSLGCLTALELWDVNTGRRMFSDQKKLVDLIKKEKISKAYWMIVELDDKKSPVELIDLTRASRILRLQLESPE